MNIAIYDVSKPYSDSDLRAMLWNATPEKAYELYKSVRGNEKVGMISIVSRSTPHIHNLFLDWDNFEKEDIIRPEISDLGGVVSRTGRGIHAIRDIPLLHREVVLMQQSCWVCEGFSKLGAARGFWTLRLSPKENNKVEVIEKAGDSKLYREYVETIDLINTGKLPSIDLSSVILKESSKLKGEQ